MIFKAHNKIAEIGYELDVKKSLMTRRKYSSLVFVL